MNPSGIAPKPKRHLFNIKSKRFLAIFKFINNNIVFLIALVVATITAFIIPPDSLYLHYFDLKTLTCLFCTLAIVCALKNIRFFTILSQKIVKTAKNTRFAIIALVYITFIGSMLIANDMALITFLPLGYYVLSSTRKEKYMAFTFIMQNISANLGGMLTPFGNPQNLYLYEKFQISNTEFVSIMALPFAVSIFLITVCCLFVKKEKLIIEEQEFSPLPIGRTVLYLAMFVFSITLVFRIVPYYIGLVIIPLILIFADKKALKKVDYFLLFTFAAFFVFSGNMARIEVVREFFSRMLEHNTLLVSVLSCQFISNVPTAILLSQFTENYQALLVGVNIGGTGTLIASLASLITFKEYSSHYREKSLLYIALFSVFNFAFLAVLTVICMLIL